MKLEEYPEKIETLAVHNLTVSEEIERLRQINNLESDNAALNISMATDERGKPVFSNETQRTLALKMQLAASEDYQTTAARIAGLEHEQKVNAFRLERLRGELSIAKLQHQRDFYSRASASFPDAT